MSILKISQDKNLSWLNLDDVNDNKNKDVSLIEHSPEFISGECDKIDACINLNEPYYYDDSWGNELIDHLREYAMASGMNLSFFIKDKQKSTSAITKTFGNNSIKKTASVDVSSSIYLDDSEPLDVLQEVWRDPFDFETKLNAPELKSNWEYVKKETKMNKPSASSQKNSIVSIGGGENYNSNSNMPLASNQNSIFSPNTIGELSESSIEDNGARLKRQREDKVASKIANHKNWENEKIESYKDIAPFVGRSVFPTESLNASSGLNRSSINGVFSDMSYENVPEKTEGEKIAKANKDRLNSIQRQKSDYDWEREANAKTNPISDLFFDNIQKEMAK